MVNKKILSQAFMFLFLLMIILGFTVHLDNDNSGNYVEPRICQYDADCYLNCQEEIVPVLCYKNLCQLNSCEQHNYYPYNQESLTFTLKGINLTSNPKNIFVKFEGEGVKVHSTGISLDIIMEKQNINQIKQMFVNGNESYAYFNYIPEQGDIIEIIQ
jgi:hypothetical protein